MLGLNHKLDTQHSIANKTFSQQILRLWYGDPVVLILLKKMDKLADKSSILFSYGNPVTYILVTSQLFKKIPMEMESYISWAELFFTHSLCAKKHFWAKIHFELILQPSQSLQVSFKQKVSFSHSQGIKANGDYLVWVDQKGTTSFLKFET